MCVLRDRLCVPYVFPLYVCEPDLQPTYFFSHPYFHTRCSQSPLPVRVHRYVMGERGSLIFTDVTYTKNTRAHIHNPAEF